MARLRYFPAIFYSKRGFTLAGNYVIMPPKGRRRGFCPDLQMKRGFSMRKVLFVCHGNICRSPLGEYVLKDMVRKAGLEEQFRIASVGVSSEEAGNPVYPPVRRLLNAQGIP